LICGGCLLRTWTSNLASAWHMLLGHEIDLQVKKQD